MNKQIYPWSHNPNGLRDTRHGSWQGNFLANFKRGNGDYAGVAGGTNDDAIYTQDVKASFPNAFGIYNMAGNVAEWTMSSYYSSSYDYASSINPNVTDSSNKRKVVRGGSWKDVAYYLQVSSRDFEVDTNQRSYIGFRTVQSYMGSDATANKATN